MIGGSPEINELADAVRELDRLQTLNAELLAALKRAVETIRALHGIGLSERGEVGMWKLYQSSPEMTAINAAINRAEGR